ncbi:MAG TPA: radical SAM protein [Methanoregulaceae archaeon]|nr:radical SAM protein [Methanoregulaceae archaeon]HPD76304.1 radical SAM protein [Methanoregulaceae archaeon]
MALPVPEAGYTGLHATGELAERVKKAAALLKCCTVCPRTCRVDRTAQEKGFCRTGFLSQVASTGPHFGEEPELVGRNGSGTIFFAHCNLACEFCQNFAISQCGDGQESDASALAAKMLMLERQGCHNINLVTPSHVVPQILAALDIAAGKGLTVPLVYNSGGYDSVETLRLLDGVVDIYMPDAKYGDPAIASLLSHAPDYVDVMKAALKEMHRQVGDLAVQKGIAVSGMIIRHLVLPGDLAGTRDVLKFIAEEISRDAYVNIMAQYRPLWHAAELARKDLRFRALWRPLQQEDYNRAIRYGKEAGLTWVNGHHQ